jgi:hypothetical protein
MTYLCGRCYGEVEELFDTRCRERPQDIVGAVGLYHCPECGAMLLAGTPHPRVCLRCRDHNHPRFDGGTVNV